MQCYKRFISRKKKNTLDDSYLPAARGSALAWIMFRGQVLLCYDTSRAAQVRMVCEGEYITWNRLSPLTYTRARTHLSRTHSLCVPLFAHWAPLPHTMLTCCRCTARICLMMLVITRTLGGIMKKNDPKKNNEKMQKKNQATLHLCSWYVRVYGWTNG